MITVCCRDPPGSIRPYSQGLWMGAVFKRRLFGGETLFKSERIFFLKSDEI
jgi:TfoX/Sxy family transcriptional regulator of competence genes